MRNMRLWLVSASCLLALAAVNGQGTPDIILSSSDGQIVWTNTNPELYYSIEWISSLNEAGWSGSFRSMQDIQSLSPLITSSVPVFFRIAGYSNIQHMLTFTNTTTEIAAGYYEATNLATVDLDLVSGNIRSGVDIFGVTGDSNVVNTATGDAAATNITLGKKAWIDGVEMTGTLAGGVSCVGTFSAGGRWCDNGDNTVTDTATGLVWLKNWAYFGDNTYYDTSRNIGTLTLGGVSVGTWRMPTRQEFLGITTGNEPVSATTPRLFTNIHGEDDQYYWSVVIDPFEEADIFHMDTLTMSYIGAYGIRTIPEPVWDPATYGIAVHGIVAP